MKLKAYIEIYKKNGPTDPTIWRKKPSKREVVNSKEFGYTFYPCTIIYDPKKPL